MNKQLSIVLVVLVVLALGLSVWQFIESANTRSALRAAEESIVSLRTTIGQLAVIDEGLYLNADMQLRAVGLALIHWSDANYHRCRGDYSKSLDSLLEFNEYNSYLEKFRVDHANLLVFRNSLVEGWYVPEEGP